MATVELHVVEGRAGGHARRRRLRQRRSSPACGMLCTSLQSPRRGVRRVAAFARRLPRRFDDRDPARPPMGQPARQLGVPRRAHARRPARPRDLRPTATACRSTATCAARRSTSSRDSTPGRLLARGSTTARIPTCSRLPVPARRRRSTRASTSAGSGSRPRSSRRGRTAVPISFCWHPYLACPPVARRQLGCCAGPRASTCAVDERIIPTGARTPQPAERAPLGRRTFDDHYALGTRPPLLGRGRRAQRSSSRFGRHYPFGQLYVPPRGDFIAIEPMTATIDALGRGTTPIVRAPATASAASFTIACGRVTPPRLLPPGAYTGFLGELCVPDDLYWVSRAAGRARRHVVPRPRRLVPPARRGIGHVVCLTHDACPTTRRRAPRRRSGCRIS